MIQLHHPGASFRKEGDHDVRLQTDASFGIIEFSDTTCMFISEPELDRLMKACGQLKGMFAGHRYQQQHQEES